MRKRLIFLLVLIFLTVVVGLPAYFFFYQAPTCFDGKQNGDEAGVDCGGSCRLLCSAEALPLSSKSDPRVLTIAPGVYEVVSLVENLNPLAEIYRARYIVKVFGQGNPVPLRTFEGEAHIPRGGRVAVFEGPFTIESGAVPTRATLEWGSPLVWQRSEGVLPDVRVVSTAVSREELAPRLDIVLENFSLETATNIDLTALLYDESGNIFAASKTFVDSISPGGKVPAVFVWPRPFGRNVLNTEVIIRFLPDRSFVR